MSRDIRVMLISCEKGEPVTLHPNWAVQTLLGLPRARRGDGMRVGGCGMDMGFAIVYDLGHTLYADGFECVGENCPSNDHSNGDRNYAPHHHRDYALKHDWL